MQKCEKCSNQFTWKVIIKSIWIRNYRIIVCDSCNAEHHVAPITRLIIGLSIGIPPLIFNLLLIPRIREFNFSNTFEAVLTVLSVYLFWLVIIICLTPFFARYKLTENNKSNI